MTLTITGTSIPTQHLRPAVMVDAAGPRGGVQHYTVNLDRRGRVLSAIRTAPTYLWLDASDVPAVVATAALRQWTVHQTT